MVQIRNMNIQLLEFVNLSTLLKLRSPNTSFGFRVVLNRLIAWNTEGYCIE